MMHLLKILDFDKRNYLCLLS